MKRQIPYVEWFSEEKATWRIFVRRLLSINILRTVFFLCIFFLYACIQKQGLTKVLADTSKQGGPSPQCSLSTENLDFGAVFANKENIRTVIVTNTGTEPLVISSIKSSCVCTKGTISLGCLAPGKQAELCVELKLDTYSKPDVDTIVVLETNDPVKTFSQLKVKAYIQPEYTVEPEMLDFGTLKCGKSYKKRFSVIPTGLQDVKVTGVEVPSGVKATIQEKICSEVKRQEITITLTPEIQQNKLHFPITILTNIPRLNRS